MSAGELEQLEFLCRDIARPPIATQRRALAFNARVVYRLKRHWRDGTSAVSFDQITFIERLAALVPPPRAHQPLRRARARIRLARSHRAQARASLRSPLPRCFCSRLTDRAQHIFALPLAPLRLGGAAATRVRCRRSHLSLTRAARAASSHSSPTQSSCARSSRTSDCPTSLHGPRARAICSTSPEPLSLLLQARSSPSSAPAISPPRSQVA